MMSRGDRNSLSKTAPSAKIHRNLTINPSSSKTTTSRYTLFITILRPFGGTSVSVYKDFSILYATIRVYRTR